MTTNVAQGITVMAIRADEESDQGMGRFLDKFRFSPDKCLGCYYFCVASAVPMPPCG
jgi:hypothetical protein